MKISIEEAYDTICGHMANVPWCKFVWFEQIVPRHTFSPWLAALLKFVNLDKLVQ